MSSLKSEHATKNTVSVDATLLEAGEIIDDERESSLYQASNNNTNATKLQPLEALLLEGVGAGGGPLTVQDLQDTLVEQSISETIMLQNANFDATNMFEDVDLDLDNTDSNNNETEELKPSMMEDNVGEDEEQPMSLLDGLDLQMLKDSPNDSQNDNNAHVVSCDPMVSSTTSNIFSYDEMKVADQSIVASGDEVKIEEEDLSDYKYLDLSGPQIMQQQQQSVLMDKSGDILGQGTSMESINTNLSLGPQAASSVITSAAPNGVTSFSIPSNQIATFEPMAGGGGKFYLATTGLPSNLMTTLSLANMKVLGQNVVAIINDPATNNKATATTTTALNVGGNPATIATTGVGGQARLIIIEDKKDAQNQQKSVNCGPSGATIVMSGSATANAETVTATTTTALTGTKVTASSCSGKSLVTSSNVSANNSSGKAAKTSTSSAKEVKGKC